jgi:hypothetical protein
MALESLVASVWRLEGFLSVVRHPLKVPGGFTDVDVLAVCGGIVRVAECKATGPARCVYADGAEWASWWWDRSSAHLARLWEQGPPWLPRVSQVTGVEYYLVGNVWFAAPSVRQHVERDLADRVRAGLPKRLRGKGRAVVSPSVELLFNAVRRVRAEIVEQGWGKRYGDPLLDALRELIRYTHPQGAGQIAKRIRDETRQKLLAAVLGEE